MGGGPSIVRRVGLRELGLEGLAADERVLVGDRATLLALARPHEHASKRLRRWVLRSARRSSGTTPRTRPGPSSR